MPGYSVIGKRQPRVDGVDKVTGRALFSADISLPNMLHGKVLRSPCAHARIRRLDTAKALSLEGVIVVVTAADVPGQKREDEQLSSTTPHLAREKSLFALSLPK